jgi:hypothetical protein
MYESLQLSLGGPGRLSPAGFGTEHQNGLPCEEDSYERGSGSVEGNRAVVKTQEE